MTEQQRVKYRKTQFFAYLAGLVSLFSFWILVPISMVMPQGHYGNIENLFQLAPLGIIIAIVGLAISLVLRSQCRRMREAALYSVNIEKPDQA
jgi:FtsH-binding integral membrane protein